MSATTSSSCSGLLSFRSNSVESKIQASSSHGSPPACGKLDGVAMWFVNGVATAFFASLERCSCIRIATEDDGEDNDVPLIHNDGNVRHDGGIGTAGSTSKRRTGKGKNKEEAFVYQD